MWILWIHDPLLDLPPPPPPPPPQLKTQNPFLDIDLATAKIEAPIDKFVTLIKQ